MPNRQNVARFLADAGLAAWFGGSLAGALGKTSVPVAFDAAAIGAHLAGASQLPRGRAQTLLTVGAVGTTAYARVLAGKDDDASQKQLAALQWAVPGLTGAVLATTERRTKPTVRDRVSEAKALAVSAAAAAIPAAKHALAAAGPTAERAREAAQSAREQAGPALERARDAAVPALEKARDAAVPVLQDARGKAGPALKAAREQAAPALERAREALPV